MLLPPTRICFDMYVNVNVVGPEGRLLEEHGGHGRLLDEHGGLSGLYSGHHAPRPESASSASPPTANHPHFGGFLPSSSASNRMLVVPQPINASKVFITDISIVQCTFFFHSFFSSPKMGDLATTKTSLRDLGILSNSKRLVH